MKKSSTLRGAADPPLGDTLDLLRLIWSVDHALQRASTRMERSIGATGPQRLVVRVIGSFPGIPAGRVAQVLNLHPSTVTGLIQRLERRGFVRRMDDPRDGRRSLLGLTEAGYRLDRGRAGTIEAAIEKLIAETPAAGMRTTISVLQRLHDILQVDTDASR